MDAPTKAPSLPPSVSKSRPSVSQVVRVSTGSAQWIEQLDKSAQGVRSVDKVEMDGREAVREGGQSNWGVGEFPEASTSMHGIQYKFYFSEPEVLANEKYTSVSTVDSWNPLCLTNKQTNC